jgi:hypothetical protein
MDFFNLLAGPRTRSRRGETDSLDYGLACARVRRDAGLSLLRALHGTSPAPEAPHAGEHEEPGLAQSARVQAPRTPQPRLQPDPSTRVIRGRDAGPRETRALRRDTSPRGSKRGEVDR